MMEKYETPEVEFVEMEDSDVICASSTCPEYVCQSRYGSYCEAGHVLD
ncbi:MAG: hypothetical protein IKP10_03275 [Clostridia bacterium]|nr:hypothetical protein [Clostridia bacterium]